MATTPPYMAPLVGEVCSNTAMQVSGLVGGESVASGGDGGAGA